jgi:hypothetical protein
MQKRTDFSPFITPEAKRSWFSWDGISYHGVITLDGRMHYYAWNNEIHEGFGPWKKVRYEYPNGIWNVNVERERQGCRVYYVYPLTDDEIKKIKRGAFFFDCWAKWGLMSLEEYRAIQDKIEYTNIKDREAFEKRTPIGYWFEEGLEDWIETFFYGKEEEISSLPQDKQDFINSLPEDPDED